MKKGKDTTYWISHVVLHWLMSGAFDRVLPHKKLFRPRWDKTPSRAPTL
jgi:hypothetical protein